MRRLNLFLLFFLFGSGFVFGADTLCRFDNLPVPNFYSRDFGLPLMGPTKDRRGVDSSRIIGTNPMVRGGFKSEWLQDGWEFRSLDFDTEVVMRGGSCEAVRVVLKKGTRVVVDAASGEILAVADCGNKVTEGRVNELEAPPSPPDFTFRVPPPAPEARTDAVVVCDPCQFKEWRDRVDIVGQYWPKRSKAEKVRLSELLKGAEGFWRGVEGADQQWIIDNLVQKFRNDKDLKWDSKKMEFRRKVQVAQVVFHPCSGAVTLQVYWEGWHWKEFFLGYLAGFGSGFGAGWYAHQPTTTVCPAVKPPFTPPINTGRP